MTNQFSGWFGEKATAWGLSQGLDSRLYRRLDDVIVPNSKGGTAQIDHVIVSQFGVFVVETKNRSGLIIGSPSQWKWQQVCNGRIYEFQNPLAQNEGHIAALARLLAFPESFFHSIVFFCGEARFRNPMPFNVRTEGVTTVACSKNRIILWPDEVNHAWDTLSAWKKNGNRLRERHVHYVQSLQGHAHGINRFVPVDKILNSQRRGPIAKIMPNIKTAQPEVSQE